MNDDKTPLVSPEEHERLEDGEVSHTRRAMLGRVAKWTPPFMITLITPARADDMGSPPPFN